MFDTWEFFVGVILGIYLVVSGIAFRTGLFRGGVQRAYFNRGMPNYSRNAVFAFVPGGLAFLLISLGAARSSSQRADVEDPLANIAILLGILALAIMFWWMVRPPEWMKPAWVREYERAEAAGEPVPDLGPRPMSSRAYLLNWLGLAAGAAIWLALGLPVGPLLIGLGLGLSVLLANPPRRRV